MKSGSKTTHKYCTSKYLKQDDQIKNIEREIVLLQMKGGTPTLEKEQKLIKLQYLKSKLKGEV